MIVQSANDFVEMLMSKIALRISVLADDWTSRSAIINEHWNVRTHTNARHTDTDRKQTDITEIIIHPHLQIVIFL